MEIDRKRSRIGDAVMRRFTIKDLEKAYKAGFNKHKALKKSGRKWRSESIPKEKYRTIRIPPENLKKREELFEQWFTSPDVFRELGWYCQSDLERGRPCGTAQCESCREMAEIIGNDKKV